MRKNKKIMKRLFGILISIVMMMGMMATTAFAKDGEATITINRPTDITTNLSEMNVHAYMVLDQVNDEEQTAAKKQYGVTSGFVDFFNMTDAAKQLFNGAENGTVYLSYDDSNNHMTYSAGSGTIAISADKLDLTYPEADIVGRIEQTEAKEGDITAKNGDIATFYTWIEKYIEEKVAKGELTEENVSSSNTGSVISLTGLNEGYYALTFSDVPVGVTVTQGILVATNGTKAAEVNLKAKDSPFTKQVKNTDHKNENFGDGSVENPLLQETTADVGDTLDYQLDALIPTVTDTTNLTEFKLMDTLHNQKLTGTMTLILTSEDKKTTKTYTATVPAFTEGSTTQTVNFVDQSDHSKIIAVLSANQYDTTDKTQTFTVDFLPTDPTQPNQHPGITDILTQYQGYSVVVKYYATVTSDAVRVNGNEAKLYIGNNGDRTEDTDETKVYTYGIEVQKKFSDQRETDKAVTFQLRTSETEASTAIKMGGSNGVYYVDANGTTGTTDLKLDGNGKLNIKGLDAGTYWLVETAAPDGFTVAKPVQIVLTGDVNGNLDATQTTAKFDGKDAVAGAQVDNDADLTVSLLKFEVLNQKGFNLPQTGGAGTWMLTIGGIVLIAAAAGLFVASRRKASK